VSFNADYRDLNAEFAPFDAGEADTLRDKVLSSIVDKGFPALQV